jgi:Kef-type K+ transport system membrane component KefB
MRLLQNLTDAQSESEGLHEVGTEDEEFYSLTMLCVFIMAAWVVGKLANLIKIPSLIGEMVVGMVLGPNLLNVVPFPEALTLVGEVGLLLLVLEAGLEVDLEMIKQIGRRGFIVALVGSFLPLLMGTGIAVGVAKLQIMEALAVGASLAPTSMAIALAILKQGKALQNPVGQLIITAAILDDVIALILLSELKALQETPTAMNIITPILSSVLFTVSIGSLAVFAIPRVTELRLIKKYSETEMFTYVCFFIMFGLCIGLMNATYYGQSSFLLGTFLAGLCFCTIGNLKHLWHKQVKRIETWMLRLFFSTTIAFKVPVKDLWEPDVLVFTVALLIPLLGKLVTGVFAPRPLNPVGFFTVGFAMSAWGEFAFVVANTSLALGIMSDSTFSSVILAVLISAIVSPWALSLTLLYGKRRKQKMQEGVVMSVRKKHGLRHAYLEVDVCCVNRWGLIDGMINLLHKIDVTVLDFTISTVQTFSIMRLYLRSKETLLDARRTEDSEFDYIKIVKEKMSEYCKITKSADRDSGFGLLPPSPYPSAVRMEIDIISLASCRAGCNPQSIELIFSY